MSLPVIWCREPLHRRD